MSFEAQRQQMIRADLEGRGLTDQRVLVAMGEVPRQEFMASDDVAHAYADEARDIGLGQTISQPYIVAAMLEAARIAPGDRLLEVGCGSGYAAAVASRLAREVLTLERLEPLAKLAASRLARLGYEQVTVRFADGTRGWPERAPFDVILVPAGADRVPPLLLEQLAIGGRLVMPVGPAHRQHLVRFTRRADGHLDAETLGAVRFVPLLPGTVSHAA